MVVDDRADRSPRQDLSCISYREYIAHMGNTTIFDRLTPILRDVFDKDDLVAKPDLNAAQVPGWDSLHNVLLFVALERSFGLRFSATEVASLKNVGQLVELIERKMSRTHL